MELYITEWCGRLGNNLIQVCNLILFCKKFKFKCIQQLDHPIIGKFELDYRDSKNTVIDYSYTEYFYITQKKSFMNMGYQFFDGDDCPNFCKAFYPFDITKKEISDIYLNIIYPNLKINNIITPLDDNTLVLHIRSGDEVARSNLQEINGYNKEIMIERLNEFENGLHKIIYVLPPVLAYETIIEKYEKVIIVAEDTLNPSINYLLNKYPNKIFIKTDSLVNDIELILSAKNFACISIYNGTFAGILSYLSHNLNNIYIFECINRNYNIDYKYKNNVNISVILLENYYNDYSINSVLNWNGNIIIDKMV